MKTIVVFYSRTGNTKFVAEQIASELGAEIEEVVDLKNREGKMGWLSAGRDATGNKETQIGETEKNLDTYELVVVGTPVWAWGPSAAIRTFLSKHSFAGKKVALFFTMDGNPRGAADKTKKLIPNAVLSGELLLTKPTADKEATKAKITEWCAKLKD